MCCLLMNISATARIYDHQQFHVRAPNEQRSERGALGTSHIHSLRAKSTPLYDSWIRIVID